MHLGLQSGAWPPTVGGALQKGRISPRKHVFTRDSFQSYRCIALLSPDDIKPRCQEQTGGQFEGRIHIFSALITMFEQYMTHSEKTTMVRKLMKICYFSLCVIMIVVADTRPGSQVVHTGFDFIIKNRVLIMP